MNSTAQTLPEMTSEEKPNPLHALSDMLEEDMLQVNTAILKRMESDVALIPQLASYLIASGGKRIRPLLTLAATALCNGDKASMARASHLAAAVEFIHTATLLHDDVVDESEERRGKKAANLVFGNKASVLVGDFLFSRAFQLMTEDGSLEVLRILSSASAVIAEGEVMQLTTTSNMGTSLQDYLKVIEAKTAALFAASCEIGPVISGSPTDKQHALRDFGMLLGIAFQMADDLLDYSATQDELGKNIGDDFREGKMTLPVLLCLEDATEEEKEFWTRTLVDLNQNDSDLKTAQELIIKHDALERGQSMALDYAQKARNCLNSFPDTFLRTLLQETVDFSVTRAF